MLKFLHQKNVITFFKWDLLFFVMHIALRWRGKKMKEKKINENQQFSLSLEVK